ncbi:MAG TPA: hypothetical protein VF662_03350 [Allosphingosinicella sp.]|jgi:hypothetical protein
MAKHHSLAQRFGDFCFRQSFAGQDPETIRRRVAQKARAAIRRSIAAGVSSRGRRSDWPWLVGIGDAPQT